MSEPPAFRRLKKPMEFMTAGERAALSSTVASHPAPEKRPVLQSGQPPLNPRRSGIVVNAPPAAIPTQSRPQRHIPTFTHKLVATPPLSPTPLPALSHTHPSPRQSAPSESDATRVHASSSLPQENQPQENQPSRQRRSGFSAPNGLNSDHGQNHERASGNGGGFNKAKTHIPMRASATVFSATDHALAPSPLIPATAQEVVTDNVNDDLMVKVNSLQSRYVSFSYEQSEAVVPSSLWHGTVKTLLDFEERNDSVMGFLGREAGWSQEQCASRLSPEQCDAAALIIDALKKESRSEREFPLYDEAGFGKGRILMTTAAWCLKNGMIPVILTDSANLFSNLWQDIQDIGCDGVFKRPFIMNNDVAIDNLNSPDGDVIFPKVSPKLHRETINNGDDLPDEFGCLMLTYSQLNTVPGKSVKVAYLERLMKKHKCVLICDESQNAIEVSSNTTANVDTLKALSYGSVDASATASRHVTNMASQRNVYRWLADRQLDLNMLSDERKLWLSEMSVVKAVNDGRIIRRELDVTGVAMALAEPDDDVAQRNVVIRDQIAVCLNRLLSLSKRMQVVCSTFNTRNSIKKASEMYSTRSFGQRRDIISSQIEACLAVPVAIQRGVAALEEDRKPFITLDMTMESALNALSSGNDDDDGDAPKEPITLQHLLQIALEKVMTYKVGKDEKVMTFDALLAFERKYGMENDARAYDDALALINGIENVSASPIDAIREGIEAEGQRRFEAGLIKKPWRIVEASGRATTFIDGKGFPNTINKNQAIAQFNFGKADGIIATSVVAVGASAHNAAKFPDQRTRRQIEVVACRDPIKRVQMWGRTNRRGNLTTPEYESVTTGTPYSLCNIAMQNAKCNHLRASVSGKRGSAMLVDVLDILSDDGNRIAKKYLIQNPQVALLCKLDAGSGDDMSYEHVRRLFKSSALLQSDVIEDMMAFFHREIELSKTRGASFATDTLGDGWEWGNESVVVAPARDFDDGVYLRRIERQSTHDGYASTDLPLEQPVSEEVKAARSAMFVESLRERHLSRYIPPYAKSVKAAFAMANTSQHEAVRRNSVIMENERCDRLAEILSQLSVGKCFLLEDRYRETRPAIVTKVVAPSDPFDFDSYEIDYRVPGDQIDYTISLAEMDGVKPVTDRAVVNQRFDAAKRGNGDYIEKRWIMTGNPMDCVMMSDMAKSGKKLEFQLSSKEVVSGIFVPDYEASRILSRTPIPLNDRSDLLAVLDAGGVTTCWRGNKPILELRSTNVSYVGPDNGWGSVAETLQAIKTLTGARNVHSPCFAPEFLRDVIEIIEAKFKIYAEASQREMLYGRMQLDMQNEVDAEVSSRQKEPSP